MIRNFEELEKTSANCGKCLDAKFTGADGKRHVVLCGGTGCLSSHSREIKEEFEKLMEPKKMDTEKALKDVAVYCTELNKSRQEKDNISVILLKVC